MTKDWKEGEREADLFASEGIGRMDNNQDEEPTQTDEIRTREMWMSRRTCEKKIANRR